MNISDVNLLLASAGGLWMLFRSTFTRRLRVGSVPEIMGSVRRAPATVSVKHGAPPALVAADCLCLAAAPSLALMAVLTGVFDDSRAYPLCSTANGASGLGGMIPMYAMMSVFHLAPWLRLIPGRRDGADTE